MSAATTIVFAREDLSIPGDADVSPASNRPDLMRARFFELVSGSRPDVIVLDFSQAPVAGTDLILTIRQRTDVPILVVCNTDEPVRDDYRIAGAADCIAAPVDIICLHRAIQRIIRVRGHGRPAPARAPEALFFAQLSFYPRRNLLTGDQSMTVGLTSLEGRLLTHFLLKPWALCTRGEIGQLLYGPDHSVGDRAIDALVNRLRKKLVSAGGADAEPLIKTEFRRGYSLAADVAASRNEAAAPVSADLASAQ